MIFEKWRPARAARRTRSGRPSARFSSLAIVILLAACGGDDGPARQAGEPPDVTITPVVEIHADVNRDGIVELDDDEPSGGDGEGRASWSAARGAIFLANIDDDARRCARVGADAELAACNDAADEVVNGEADLLDLARLKTRPWPEAPDDAQGRIVIDEAARPHVRLFRKVEAPEAPGSFEVFDTEVAVLDAEALREGVEFGIEGKGIVLDAAVWDGLVTVTFQVEGLDDGPVEDVVQLRQAPVLLRHHLDDAERVFATTMPTEAGSRAFIADLELAMEAAGLSAELEKFAVEDQWTQDFFENGYMAMPSAGGMQVIQVYFRSANLEYPESLRPLYERIYGMMRYTLPEPLRPAGRVVYTQLHGPDVAGVTVFDPNKNQEPFDLSGYDLTDVARWLYGLSASGEYHDVLAYIEAHDRADTLDSFGNTETIPPYSHGERSYPLGRIIRGANAEARPDRAFSTMLEAQGVQDPVVVDTLWLLVAHVDETMSFVPADNERGWVLLFNDPALARQMLQEQHDAGHGEATVFAGKYQAIDYERCQPTAGGYRCPDPDPAWTTITEILDDEDLMAASAAAAVALDAQRLVLEQETGLTEADIVPVPFLHEDIWGGSTAYQPGTVNGIVLTGTDFGAPRPHGPRIDEVDLFEAHMNQTLAELGIDVHFIEDWDLYHVNLGDVHCGSNVERMTPVDFHWWEHAP